jgi:hypothetical protein
MGNILCALGIHLWEYIEGGRKCKRCGKVQKY